MAELIVTIILGSSLIGMGVILFKKIPVLVKLPETSAGFNLREKIKILNPFKNFSSEIFLQKVLSKIRILSLKAENKTANWLQKLRERYRKKKNQENDNYWQELKKSAKKRKKETPR